MSTLDAYARAEFVSRTCSCQVVSAAGHRRDAYSNEHGVFLGASAACLSIINETDKRVRVTTDFGHEIEVRRDGGLNGFNIEECRRVRVTAYWPDGRLLASRHRACPDQVWIIVDRGCVGIRPSDTPGLRTEWDTERLGCGGDA
jgi:hypothetical protein